VYREESKETAIIAKSLLIYIIAETWLKSVDNSATPATRTPQCRLPSFALPTFSGKHSEFKNFISLLETFVDKDDTIHDIEKFNHLISCLAGDALGTVRAFQVTADNYPKALASLRRVYNNDCLIFFDNFPAISFPLEKPQRHSHSALRFSFVHWA